MSALPGSSIANEAFKTTFWMKSGRYWIAIDASVPISLEFSGNFYDLNDFLFRLRTLVSVRGGKLGAVGRMFSVSSIDFAEGQSGFPNIHATLHVNAYVYGTGVPASTVAPPTTPATTTSTTPTTTTPATTTTPTPTSSTPPVAGGVAP